MEIGIRLSNSTDPSLDTDVTNIIIMFGILWIIIVIALIIPMIFVAWYTNCNREKKVEIGINAELIPYKHVPED